MRRPADVRHLAPRTRAPALWQSLRFAFGDPVVHLARLRRRQGAVFRFDVWGPRLGRVDGAPGAPLERTSVVCCTSSGSIEALLGAAQAEAVRPVVGLVINAMMGPRSLFRVEGEDHRRHQRLMAPALDARAARRIVEAGEGELERALGALARAPGRSVLRWSQELNVALLLPAILGPVESEQKRALARSAIDVVERLSPARLWVPALNRGVGRDGNGAKVARAVDRLRQFVRERVRRAPGAGTASALAAMTASRSGRADAPLSGADLEDELVALLFGTALSPSSALAWTAYWVGSRPGLQERLRAESRAAPPGAPVGAGTHPLLDATCKESLRLTPPVSLVLRRARSPMRVGGYDVRAGDHAIAAIHLLHRDPALYPEPLRFRPERFLERSYGPFEFMPHGAGARRCPGRILSHEVLRAVVARLVDRFEVRVDPRCRVRHGYRNVTMVPLGLRLRLRERARPAYSRASSRAMRPDGSEVAARHAGIAPSGTSTAKSPPTAR